MRPDLSVVICTRDRVGCLVEALGDVLVQLGPHDEVLVVDQSEDPAPAAAWITERGQGRVRHLVDAGRGLPRARRLGVEATTGRVIWFLDDDVRLLPGCLDAHRAAYADAWVGGVVGRLEGPGEVPNAPRTTNRVGWDGRVRVRLTEPAPAWIETLKGANMSLRRAALAAAGPPDEGYAGTAFLEDADWSTRVRRQGWRLRYVPSAAVRHLQAPTGGCRTTDARASWWRFRNTGYFVARHRPWSLPLVAVGFTGVAVRRAVAWREPGAAPRLLGALVRGFVEGWR